MEISVQSIKFHHHGIKFGFAIKTMKNKAACFEKDLFVAHRNYLVGAC